MLIPTYQSSKSDENGESTLFSSDLKREENLGKTIAPEFEIGKKKELLTEPFSISKKAPKIVVSPDNISDAYLEFNTVGLISNIEKELDSWIKNGTDDSLVHILNIKKLVDIYYKYLSSKAETRMFANVLELIFQNNNWEQLSTRSLSLLKEGIARFKEGVVENKEFIKFISQISKLGISPIKSNEEEKQN